MPHLEGREVGGCKLIRKIGSGGMGDVYLGEQIRVGNRTVAVKVVSPDDMTLHPEAAADIARRFEREAAILGNLSHPNILPVHDSGIQDGMLYLVMEYAPDGSLADALRGASAHPLVLPLSVPFTLDIISQVAAALEYTHEKGIVHRDVKPGNVLIRIEPNGHWHVLLADFGVARAVEVDSQRTQVSGTFIYMAPEQFSAKFSPASDQYALAVMTFQLLAGRPPFDGDLASLTRQHMYEQPPSLHALNPDVPPAVEAVVARALSKDPAQRFPSVAQFAASLNAAAGLQDDTTIAGDEQTVAAAARGPAVAGASSSRPIVAPETPTSIARARRRASPWRWLVTGLAALLLVALLIGGEQYLSKHSGQPTATATQTAIASTHQTETAQAAPTATSTPAVTSTAASSLALPTCTSPLAIGDNADCVPAPPSSVTGAVVLNEPSPGCLPSSVTWTPYSNTGKDCSATDGTQLTAKSSGQLGCLEAQQITTSDGYASVFVTQGTGSPVLVFRQGEIQSNGTGVFSSTGYFFKVTAQTDLFVFYRVDSTGTITTIRSGGIPGQLAAHFVMSVLYTGSTFTFYINGQPIGSATDSATPGSGTPGTTTPAISSGWYGLCVDGGEVSFRSAQNKSAAS
jgi:serine/threonine protein kinase